MTRNTDIGILIAILFAFIFSASCSKQSKEQIDNVEIQDNREEKKNLIGDETEGITTIDTTETLIKEETIKLPKGIPALNFELVSTTDDKISLESLKGELVLLEFWFPGCLGCLKSIPMLNNLHYKYKDKGLHIYGIEHKNVTKEEVLNYAALHNMQFPNLLNGKAVSKDYGVWLAPTFFLINQKGEIVFEHSYSDKNEAKLTALIDQYLK